MARLIPTIQRYRTPILIGVAAKAGLYAYSRRSAELAGGSAGSPTSGTGAPVLAGGQSGAEALAAAQAGGNLALQGAGLGLAPVGQALDLAGLAVGGSQALAAGISGDFTGLAAFLGGSLADVAGQAIGSLPSFAPAAGITPQPTTPPTTPQPTPAPAPTRTFLRYEVVVTTPGTIRGFIVGSTGTLRARDMTFNRVSAVTVSRRVDGGRLHWRQSSGGYAGVSFVPGLSISAGNAGAWAVRKVYRLSTGAIVTENISKTAG